MVALNRLFHEDSRNILNRISPGTVDVVITSPPYADLKDYGAKGQIGHGQDYETEYLPALKDIFAQCLQVTKDSGSLWVVVDTFKKHGEVCMLPFHISMLCKEVGWTLSDIIIWHKGKTLPWSHKGRLRNIFEYILFFTKTKNHKYFVDRIKDPLDLKEWWVKYPERYAPGGKVPSNIWEIPIPVQGSWSQNGIKHLCPFPPELVERILLLTTNKGDVVLDPFAGSGMVLAQADCMGRKFLGFEINKHYVHQFKTKVAPSIKQAWKKNQALVRYIQNRRAEFEIKIRDLRLLKYPKAIFKRIKSKRGVNTIIGLIVAPVAVTVKSDQRFKVKIVVLLNEPGYMRTLNHHIGVALAKPPISKFGIKASVSFQLVERFFRDERKGGKFGELYAYLGGKTHHYDEKLTINELETRLSWEKWKALWKNHLPPIFSPIGIRQAIQKTWKPRHERIFFEGFNGN